MCIRPILVLVILCFTPTSLVFATICPHQDIELSQLESDQITYDLTDVGGEEGFYIRFPAQVEDHEFKSAAFYVVNDSGKPDIALPLATETDEDGPWVEFSVSKILEQGVYVQAYYGTCIRLGRTVRAHNKSLNTDASDAGAG